MFVLDMLKEYSLELDDVRWFLSCDMVNRLIHRMEDFDELSKWIWSGELEAELYNMEEKFLAGLEDEYERGLKDESYIRELYSSIRNKKRSRVQD